MTRLLLAVLALCLLPAPVPAQQLTPPGTGGIAALDRALARLAQNKRVLLIAAHPDDEDTELLTLLSRGLGVETAYLSLTRGEGGQNLIGAELGDQLGLIRTGELLAARQLHGAHQYFTRGFDFGFSRSPEETLRHWPRDTLIADVLRIVRRFQPQVIVTVFSGTPRDGHGQHQASAVVARDVFMMLRDSAWGPAKLYRTARFDSSGGPITLGHLGVDPFEGRSYYQMAMRARSLHRSQDMGMLQRLGTSTVRVVHVASAERRLVAAAGNRDPLFAGVDTALPRTLGRYRALIDSARAAVHPRDLSAVLPLLSRALAELRRAAPAWFRDTREPLLAEAMAAAAGVLVDAVADDGRVTPGQQLRVSASVWNAGRSTVTTRDITVLAPPAWGVRRLTTEELEDGGQVTFLRVAPVPTTTFLVTVPPAAEPTQPYFLARPRAGALYDWSAAPDSLRGEALNPPLLQARFRLTVAGAEIELLREVAHRISDQASGEVRKPVIVVPPVGVTLSPGVSLWPTRAAASRTFQVELTAGSRDTLNGFVRLVVPDGWPAVPPQPFTLAGEDTRRSFIFRVAAPAALRPGTYEIRAVADVEGGRPQSLASHLVDYPHLRPVAWVSDAATRAVAADVVLPRLRLVGYVRGASDMVPEALEAIGVPVALLSPAHLERGDLSAYDVIVIGSRAYETDPALVANNGRLLEWVRSGGSLLVQYQQYQFVRGGFAPFPMRIGQPHDRVTDEAAPVTMLDPAEAAFREPNVIGAADWEGWIQERGLYFARDWDDAWRPLLELGDNGQRLRGGLLVARYGRGLYTYTGLAFFRQLPAGVPGAYRLFLNLLGMRPTDAP